MIGLFLLYKERNRSLKAGMKNAIFLDEARSERGIFPKNLGRVLTEKSTRASN